MAGSLRRTLNLWQVSLSGIGVILGAGVYALIGPAAAQAGNALWLSFLLAGLTAGLTAYGYARLARLVPKNSPEFQYTAMAFGPTVGFYGMAASGVLPKRFARVGRTAIPLSATMLVLFGLAMLVTIGTLQQVAAMTDAAVLVSFMFVERESPVARRAPAYDSVRSRPRRRGPAPVARLPAVYLAFTTRRRIERDHRARPLRPRVGRGVGKAGPGEASPCQTRGGVMTRERIGGGGRKRCG